MSAYLNFFVRINDNFAPIGTYGRSTQIYQLFDQFAPYEQISPITYDTLNSIKQSWRERSDDTQNLIDNSHKRIGLIPSFANSIEDKMDALAEEESYLSELEDTKKELDNARAFIGFLYDILDDIAYGEGEGYKVDEYIYIGVECGAAVGVNDIAK